MKVFSLIIVIFLCSSNVYSKDTNYTDKLLIKIIKAYELQPHIPKHRKLEAKETLGKNLFFDPIMSGPHNTACATCHIRSKDSVDSLPMAVGIGSSGVGKERLRTEEAFVIPRNVLPFFNRGADDFTAFFWDGRVQLATDGGFESPLGNLLPMGFDNLLAVAAIFPPVEPDEMLGRSLRRGGNKKHTYHADLVSKKTDPDNFQLRTLDIFKNLPVRIIGSEGSTIPSQVKYRALFKSAFPNSLEYNITDIGNALSAYIDVAFELRPSPWDRYIQGELNAISDKQKQGAIVFYGNGRCAVCHSGTEFSDFKYHSLAIPQLGVGKHGGHLDYGRAKATSLASERYQFRTPPLRNVTKTGPWGHNGSFSSLEKIIEHHFNPIPILYAAQQGDQREAQLAGRLLGYRSQILAQISSITNEDIYLLIKFLESLESETVMSDLDATPLSVPSGMNDFL